MAKKPLDSFVAEPESHVNTGKKRDTRSPAGRNSLVGGRKIRKKRSDALPRHFYRRVLDVSLVCEETVFVAAFLPVADICFVIVKLFLPFPTSQDWDIIADIHFS